MTKLSSSETYSHDGPECPHCGHTLTPDESHYYDERYNKDTCPECDHTFSVEVHNSTSWTCTNPRPPENP
jgi:ribosomal protein L37AE/L43A